MFCLVSISTIVNYFSNQRTVPSNAIKMTWNKMYNIIWYILFYSLSLLHCLFDVCFSIFYTHVVRTKRVKLQELYISRDICIPQKCSENLIEFNVQRENSILDWTKLPYINHIHMYKHIYNYIYISIHNAYRRVYEYICEHL